MDLATLKFKVETDEVEAAVKSVDRLVDAVEKLEKPIGQMVTSAKKVADAAGDLAEGMGKAATAAKPLAQNTEAAGDSLSKVERMIEKAGLSLAILRNQTVGASDGNVKLTDSFTKMQAGMLATAKMAGASVSELQQLASIIKQTNDAMGQNPFDKSASGLARLKKEVEEMTSITALQSQGLALTGKELQDYARDITRVTAAMQAEGASLTEVNAALERLKRETLEASQAKAVFTRQAKEAEEQIKREAQAKLAAERAAMSMNNEAVALFMENEKKKQKAVAETEKLIRDQAAAQQRQQLQSQYVSQGFSTGSAGRAATMQMKGVPQDVINSFLLQAKAMEENNRAARQTANALRYLDDTEAKLNEQLKEGVDMHHRFTDQLVRVRTELAKTGLSTAAATKRYEELERKINAVAAKDKQRELANLSRAISVQMGDVGISLASGMNPLLVMIQQGDQIRGAIQQVGVEGKQLQGAMTTAAAQIASSFVLTGKAIGGFVVGAIASVGSAIADVTKQIPGINAMTEAYRKFANTADVASVIATGNASKMATVIRGLGASFTFAMGAASVFAATLALAVPVALIQSIRQNEELVRSLTLSGGALGLSTESAYRYAMSMNDAGVSTAKAMEVIAQMGKTGELGANAIEMVTLAANDLQIYGGVAIEDTVKKFASLAKDPVDALFKIAKETGMVSEEALRLVEALKLQGKETEAQAAAMRAYADVTSQQIARLKEDYTSFGMLMINTGQAIKKLYTGVSDSIKGLMFNGSKIADLQYDLAKAQSMLARGGGAKWREEAQRAQAQLRVLLEAEERKAAAANLEARQLELQKEAAALREKGLTKEEAYFQKINQLREKIAKAKPEDVGAFTADMVRTALEYNKSLEEQADKRNKLTDAQREANKLKNDEEALIKRIREQMNGSVAQQLQLSAAEKMRLDILGDERFKSQPETVRKAIEALLQQAIATERVADAEAARLKAHDDVNAALRRGNAVLGKATDMGSEYYNVQDAMFNLLESGAKIGLDYSDYVLRVLAALEATTPAARATADANKSLAEMTRELSLETYNAVQALEDERNEMILGSEENKRRIQMRKIDAEWIKDITAAIKAKNEAEAKGGTIDIAAYSAAIAAANGKRDALIRGLETDVNSFVVNLRKMLPDVVYDAFTGKSKDAAKRIRDMLVDELVKKPITIYIKAVTDQLANSFNGMFTENGSFSFGKMVETGTAAFDGIKKFFSGDSPDSPTKDSIVDSKAATSSMFSLYAAAAVMVANAASKDQARGFNGNAARQTGRGMDPLSNVIGDIFADTSTNLQKILGLSQKWADILSMSTGFAKTFGRSLPRLQGTNIVGTVGESGFSGSINNRYVQKGGFLRGDKTINTQTELTGDLANSIGKATVSARQSMIDYAKSLGLNAESVAKSVRQFNADITGLSQADAVKKIEEEIANYTESLAKEFAPAMERFRLLGESSTETLTRLATTLKDTNQVLELLGHTIYSTSLVGGASAQALIDNFGDLSTFVQSTSSYYDNFYTETERAAKATQQLSKALSEVGVSSIPRTREEYRALVESQDLTSESGRKTYAALIKLSSIFDELNPKLDTLGGKFGTLVGNLFNDALTQIDAQIAASEQAASAARRVAEEYFSMAESLTDYARSLRGETAGDSYRSILAAAQGGDIDAMGKLQNAAERFIESARQNSTSTEEYNRQVAQIQQEILQVAAVANVQGTAANYQAQLLDINTAVLEEIKASIENQNVTADLLREQLDALATVGELITASANLTVAQSITNTGELKTGLIDNAGNVVASIDATTAQQLAAVASQTSNINNAASLNSSLVRDQISSGSQTVTSAVNSNTTATSQVSSPIVAGLLGNSDLISAAVTNSTTGQTVSLNNLIGGNIANQTTQLAGLSADQLAALTDVESAGIEQVDIAEIVARASTESSALLRSVVSRLDSDNSSFANLIATVGTGNEAIRTTLNNILLQLQVNGEVPGVDQGFVGPIATQQQLALNAAQALLVQIRDTQLPGITNAETIYNEYIGSSQYAANEAEYALTGDYRVVQDQRAQAEILNQQLADLIARLQRDLDAQRQIIISLGGVPAFAQGGMHSGGLRLVGENGPELEVTGPSRIFNARETASMLGGGDNSELLEKLIEKVSMLEAAARATAVSSNKVAKILDRVSPDGNSLQISPAV